MYLHEINEAEQLVPGAKEWEVRYFRSWKGAEPPQNKVMHAEGEYAPNFTRTFPSLHSNQKPSSCEGIMSTTTPLCPSWVSSMVLYVLSAVIQHLFNCSLSLDRVWLLWKTSYMIPVNYILTDRLQPVSFMMKALKRLDLHLQWQVKSPLDLLKFRFRRSTGVQSGHNKGL